MCCASDVDILLRRLLSRNIVLVGQRLISFIREKITKQGVFVDYIDTQISYFAIECLRKNEKVHETVLACSYGQRRPTWILQRLLSKKLEI